LAKSVRDDAVICGVFVLGAGGTIRVAMTEKHATWTVEDYLRLPDDGTRCEIIDGERLMTPSPFPPHQCIASNVVGRLLPFVKARALGRVMFAPSDVFLSKRTVVQPDVYFISNARGSIYQPRGIFGAPDFVIEILSEDDPERDRVRKRRLYARHGVREYWIVDPQSRRIEVFVLEGRRLVLKATHDSGEVRSLAVLPGFTAPLDAIFERSL
jgi:Uma2 family endonuclease